MYTVFVGQWVDEHLNQAQTLNARFMLRNFSRSDVIWVAPFYRNPDRHLVNRPNIRLVKLRRHRLESIHRILFNYLSCDAVFYASSHWTNSWLLPLIGICRKNVPVIRTIEAFAGDEQLFKRHPFLEQHRDVFHILPERVVRKGRRIAKGTTHYIAISEFMGDLYSRILNQKVDRIPLGIDTNIFNSGGRGKPNDVPLVLCAGTVYERKRPGVFLELANKFPEANFRWYGKGNLREPLLKERDSRGINNLDFPGSVSNEALAEEYRGADLFVLPSHCEGVPKVSQEAAACGLPVILFGHYRAPTVIDEHNGYVVWNDEELFARVGQLINHRNKARELGKKGARMAMEWEWKAIAPRWESLILEIVSGF